MNVALFVGLMLGGALPSVSAEAQPLTHEFRAVRGESDYRALERSSILYGRTELRVTAEAPHRVVSVTVVSEGRYRASGDEHVLCRSSESATGCVADFGDTASRHALRVDTEVRNEESGASSVVSKRFVTLDAHPEGDATSTAPDVLVEHTGVSASPPDQVTRLVRVEATAGKSDGGRMEYRDDLARDNFRIKVEGIRDAKIVSVRPPDPERRKLIPILFNAAAYLTTRLRGQPEFDWQDNYEDTVLALVQGLRIAASRGVDVEYVVVIYAATGKVFGPFRLHLGSDLDETQRRFNDETLEALRRFLEAPPLPRWREKYANRWVDNFGGTVHTLNDLYLREFDGLVQAVWVTDGGTNSSGPLRHFQEEMWPERLEELNPEWSDAGLLELLERLDERKGPHDEAMAEFIDLLDDYRPQAAGHIRTFLNQLDPEGTQTLHPHRVDSSPMLSALFVTNDRWARADRSMQLADFIQRDYGGQVYKLRKLDDGPAGSSEEGGNPSRVTGLATVPEVLQRTYEQLSHSYVVEVEVANPHQDGARHTLRFSAVEPRANGKWAKLERFNLAYMPYYTSSGSVRSRLADYMRSGFKDLRLLSAYELRNHWFEDELLQAWADRWQQEDDDQVRAVLFESWISINLKRLQAGGSTKKNRRWAEEAYGKLRRAGDMADRLESPDLARQAATVAEWYRADHPEPFGD